MRHIGPAPSWLCEIGTIPRRLTNPTVGLIPTKPFAEDGHTIDPSVSVPIAAAQKFAETAAPDPELDPQGLRSRAYGFLVCPPRPLQPLVECRERMFAHSLRLVFPMITAPASRSLWTTVESFGGFDPTSASDPAVVIILSAVSMLSLINTGIPCSGPRAPFSFLSRSEASARASASGFNSMTLFTAGPCLSSASIRAKYFSAIARAVYFTAFIPSCSSVIVISSNSNVGTPGKLSGRSRASTDSILITGATAAAKPPAKLLRKNALRPFSVFKVQLLS